MTSTQRAALAVLLMALASGSVLGQTGGIRARVLDAADRRPLPGATVTLTNPLGLVPTSTQMTGPDGDTVFPVLRSGGAYRLQVAFPGYARVEIPDLRVRAGEILDLPVLMTPERVERETVLGRREVVELSSTSASTRFSDEFVQELPIQGRHYQSILVLAPGVQDSDGDGNPNVHGARSRDFKAMVDGVSNQDPLTGEWLSQVNPDSIEEIEVLTAGAGVEFGRAQGGFARIVQKQGSNDFEGVVNFLYRSSKLDGDGATNVPEERVPEFDLIQPSIQVSGPISKGRVWYRLSHEFIDSDEPVNTLNAVAVSNRTQTISADQLTWQVSQRNRLALQFQSDPLVHTNVGISSGVPPEAAARYEQGGPTYSLTWTAPFSSKVLVESLAAYQNHHSNILPMTTGIPNNCVIGYPVHNEAQCSNLDTGLTSGSYYLNWRDQRQRFTTKSQATFSGGRFLGARHEFKVGFSAENERYHRDLLRTPDMTFFRLKGGFITADQDRPRGLAIMRFAVPDFSTAVARETSWALYAEDQLRPLPNLTATLGVRLDNEVIHSDGFLPFDPAGESQAFYDLIATAPPETWGALAQFAFTAYDELDLFTSRLADQLGYEPVLGPSSVQSTFWSKTRRPGNIDLNNTNVSPRLAVSWDPWSDGKTKFAITAGRYYDKLFLGIPLIELEPVTTTLTFDTTLEDDGIWYVQRFDDAVNPALNVQVVDRNLRTPFKDEYTLSFEREISRETSLKVTYIRSRYRDQLQDVDINRLPGDFGRCVIPALGGEVSVVPSGGSGQVLVDPYSGVSYVDTDPGDGDGALDDCVGLTVVSNTPPSPYGSVRESLVQHADGVLDLYIQNPAWGSIFLVGNFNTADYRALVLELVRRNFRNWQLEASYTYSRAIGDAEDFQVALGDDRTTLVDEHGFLSYDQRHVAKLNAVVVTPWAIRLGTAVSWQSGLPYSSLDTVFSFAAIPPLYSTLGTPDPGFRTLYPTHQRNDQRNPSYWNFDARVAKEIPLSRGTNLQLTAEVFNLLNDDTILITSTFAGKIYAVRRFGRRFQVGFRLSF